MMLTAYQVACLAAVGIIALSFALVCLIAWGMVAIAQFVESSIRRHSNDAQ